MNQRHAAAGRFLAQSGAWIALISTAVPWFVDRSGVYVGVTVGEFETANVIDLNDWGGAAIDGLLRVDVFAVLIASIVIWNTAMRWSSTRMRVATAGAGLVPLVAGTGAFVTQVAEIGSPAVLYYGAHLSFLAGLLVIGGVAVAWSSGDELAEHEPFPLMSIFDQELSTYATPRLIRSARNIAATGLVAFAASSLVAETVQNVAVFTTTDGAGDVATFAGSLMATSIIVMLGLLLLRVAAEVTSVVFDIALNARPSSQHVEPPAPTPPATAPSESMTARTQPSAPHPEPPAGGAHGVG